MEISSNKAEDSIVFSSLYTNYESYLKNDNPKNRHGIWKIEKQRLDLLKYAYVYLTDSGGMIVRKYKIHHFEPDTQVTSKHHFYFEKGEDFFIQYPFGIVRKHHYVFSSQLENIPRLETLDIHKRLNNSMKTKMNKERKEKIIKISAREKLSLSYQANNLPKKQYVRIADIAMLEKLVNEGQEPDAVLTNYFNNLETKKNLLNKDSKKD